MKKTKGLRRFFSLQTWQRVFLTTLLLVLAAVGASSMLLLSSYHRSNLEREKQSALSEYNYLVSTIKNNLLYKRLKSGAVVLSQEEVRTELKELFANPKELEQEGISFYRDGETILREGISKAEREKSLLTEAEESFQKLALVRDGEEKVLMIASVVQLEGISYTVVRTRDVGGIYTLYDSQLRQVRVITVGCALVVAVVLLLMVWLLLRPIRTLREGAAEIARGNYQKRIAVRGHGELAELADDMNQMAEAVEKNVGALERVSENRRQFIANLAHEMKTPLTSILGFADILRIKRSVTEEERQEYAGVIIEETKRLRSLSGKLMELITVGNTELDWKMISLEVLFRDVCTVLRPVIENRGLHLVCTVGEGSLLADAELLKSLLYNLVDNASKASAVGQRIELNAKQTEERIIISICDYGIGIPQEELDKIEEPFYMVDKVRTRKAGGAGLGLALCREIARLHGGSLLFESKPGAGTCVTVTLSSGTVVKGGA